MVNEAKFQLSSLLSSLRGRSDEKRGQNQEKIMHEPRKQINEQNTSLSWWAMKHSNVVFEKWLVSFLPAVPGNPSSPVWFWSYWHASGLWESCWWMISSHPEQRFHLTSLKMESKHFCEQDLRSIPLHQLLVSLSVLRNQRAEEFRMLWKPLSTL